ncbi:LIM domain-binding protein 2, partial [Varanus komodoensis]
MERRTAHPHCPEDLLPLRCLEVHLRHAAGLAAPHLADTRSARPAPPHSSGTGHHQHLELGPDFNGKPVKLTENWSHVNITPSPRQQPGSSILNQLKYLDRLQGKPHQYLAVIIFANSRIGLTQHIMRKAGLDESQVGIKIAGRNINNLRYADDTTLMAESEEKLKSLLMRVKEESAKVGLKLNIKKTKIIQSYHFLENRWGRNGGSDRFYFPGLQDHHRRDCSQEIKRHLLLGRKAMANLDSILKSRDITLPTEVRIVKAMVFPVTMYDCESWTIRKAEHRKIEPLNCGAGGDSCDSLGLQGDQTDIEDETQIVWPPNEKEGLPGEEPNAGNNRGEKKKGTAEDETVAPLLNHVASRSLVSLVPATTHCRYFTLHSLSLNFNSAIGRTLIPRYFSTVFEGGVTDLYYILKHSKESYHNSSITVDCDQCTMVTQHGKPMFTKVCTEGRLILEFTFDDLMRIKTWHFTIRQYRELVPRSILAMHAQDPQVLEQLSKNITRMGLTNFTLNYLR